MGTLRDLLYAVIALGCIYLMVIAIYAVVAVVVFGCVYYIIKKVRETEEGY